MEIITGSEIETAVAQSFKILHVKPMGHETQNHIKVNSKNFTKPHKLILRQEHTKSCDTFVCS